MGVLTASSNVDRRQVQANFPVSALEAASLLALECIDIDAHHSHFACNNTTPTHDARTP
jgi:hypothetical protein